MRGRGQGEGEAGVAARGDAAGLQALQQDIGLIGLDRRRGGGSVGGGALRGGERGHVHLEGGKTVNRNDGSGIAIIAHVGVERLVF